MSTVATSLPLAPATAPLRRALSRAGNAVWRALAASGQARARRELLAFAERCEGLQPELAKELRLAAAQSR